MPQVMFAPAAIRDLQRLRDFLRPKNADAARRAGEAIRQGVKILGTQPRLGRMVDDLPQEFREWLIDFGDSGYDRPPPQKAESVKHEGIRRLGIRPFILDQAMASDSRSRWNLICHDKS